MITVNADILKSILAQAKVAVMGMQEAIHKGESGLSAWQAYKQQYLDAIDEMMEQGMTETEAKKACNQFLS